MEGGFLGKKKLVTYVEYLKYLKHVKLFEIVVLKHRIRVKYFTLS